VDELTNHIAARLANHPSCTVFENHLDGTIPNPGKDDAKRQAEIHAFAEANGWVATINDPGIRVTFRRPRKSTR